MKIRKTSNSKIRLMVFQGSARNETSCPGMDSKTKDILEYAIKGLSGDVEIDYCDLSVKGDGDIIQPCKGCISTAGGYHCHWHCDCYSKNDKKIPDYMHNEDIYRRLELCDGFAVFSPINWYSVPTQVKAMFDRLVCMSGTLTVEDAKKVLGGKKNLKNPEVTRALGASGEYDNLLKNHLAGKYAAFFCHGDDGADDYTDRPYPPSFTEHMDEKDSEGHTNRPTSAVLPLVWTCRYSGINVPNDLVAGAHMNSDTPYAEAADRIHNRVFETGRELLLRLAEYCGSAKKKS